MGDKNDYNLIIILAIIMIFIFAVSTSAQQNLTADKLVFEKNEEGSKIVNATGNVKLIYNDMEVTGDKAVFEQKNQQINFEGNVNINMEEKSLKGKSLIFKMEKEVLEISGNVVLKTENFTTKSNHMIYERSKGLIDFTGEAYIDYDTITANCDSIRIFEKEDRAVLKGNVSGQQDGNNFKAEQIEILERGNKIELTGKAQLIFNQEE